ncbi:MAG: hypothetical protein R3F17_13865 [Planctomycetota bacterium]
MAQSDELRPAWTLVLGPGADLRNLERHLRAAAGAHPEVRIECQESVRPPVPQPTLRGRWVLDVATLSGRHLYDLADFLAQASGWELVLWSAHGEPHIVQQLVGPAHVVWWPGPLDLARLDSLLEPPRARDLDRGVQLAAPSLPNEPEAAQATGPDPFEDDWDLPAELDPEPVAEFQARISQKATSPARTRSQQWEDQSIPNPGHGAREEDEMGAIQAILSGGARPAAARVEDEEHPMDWLEKALADSPPPARLDVPLGRPAEDPWPCRSWIPPRRPCRCPLGTATRSPT